MGLARCLFSSPDVGCTLTSLTFFFPQWCSSPLSVSARDISQWAGRRKRREEAAGAPSRFYPLLHPTSLSFVCVCVCVLASALTQQSLKAFGGRCIRGVWGAFLWLSNSPLTPSEEHSASALPMSQPLSLIRNTGPQPIQLMCGHNAPQIHPTSSPLHPPPHPPLALKSPLHLLFAAAAVYRGRRKKDISFESTGMIFREFKGLN